MTLYLRNLGRLRNPDSGRVRIIEGDVLDVETLKEAMIGQDVVYANLAGALERMAKNIVETMDVNGVKRIIFIYDEIPGEFGKWNKRNNRSIFRSISKIC